MKKSLLCRAFGIYPNEQRNTLRFARLSVFWAFGSSCFETLADGLFLTHVGSSDLPIVYFTIALSMLLVSSIVLYSLKVSSPYRILMCTMCAGIVLCSGAAFIVNSSPPEWFWYILKVSSRMFFSVMIACSWTFTDQYHDLQDAKRVYSLYSAAYFLGSIISGSVINLFFDKIGYTGLLLCAAGAVLIAMGEARKIAYKIHAVHDDSVEGVFAGSRESIPQVISLIRQSPFAIFLLSLSLITQLLLVVTEFNYMDTFGHHFRDASAPDGEIAEFLGRWRAIISSCNILTGLFLYSRCVRKLGLSNVILVTPLFFLMVYAGWVVEDAMLFGLLGLIAVDGVLFTFEDNCFNLLSNAVPTRLKSRVRIINDSFFEPIGMLLCASILFVVQAESKWLGFWLAVAVLLISLVLRSTYAQAILVNLKDNALHCEKRLSQWLSSLGKREERDARQDLLQALQSRIEGVSLTACEALLELEDPSVLPPLVQASSSFSTMDKIQLLRLLEASPFAHDSRVIEMVDLWMESDSPQLIKWANLYLAKQGLHHPEQVEDALDSADLHQRGAAILTLKRSLANHSLAAAPLNRTIATKKLDLMLHSSHIDEVSLGLDILSEEQNHEAVERAIPFLDHEAIIVKRAAARCIARLADKRLSRHAETLIEQLEECRDNHVRLHCLDALGQIGDSTTVKEILIASARFRPNERRRAEEIVVRMGLKTVPLLLALTKDAALPDRSRILAGKILSRLALPQLQANLIDILDIEIERAYFYFYFSQTIQKQYPLYDLSMLENALLTGYQSVVDFIIHLLGAAGSLEDPEVLVRALHSRNAKIQSHAVESLERTCSVPIFRMVAPLVDDLPLEEKMSACLNWYGDLPKCTLPELLAKLEHSPSLFDKLVAARLKRQLEMPNWRQELREQLKHSSEPFHPLVYELLNS